MKEYPDVIEDDVFNDLSAEDYIRQLDPEIQAIFYNTYGENLETLPSGFLNNRFQTIELLERLMTLTSRRFQKVILYRLGVVTGTPMSAIDAASEFGIPKDRILEIEGMFLRKRRPRTLKKKAEDPGSEP